MLVVQPTFTAHPPLRARDPTSYFGDMNMEDRACYHCGQIGHLFTDCPARRPAAPPARVAVQDTPWRELQTIECPTCQRDWVLKGDTAETLTCPWCRKFETRDGEVYHRVNVSLK